MRTEQDMKRDDILDLMRGAIESAVDQATMGYRVDRDQQEEKLIAAQKDVTRLEIELEATRAELAEHTIPAKHQETMEAVLGETDTEDRGGDVYDKHAKLQDHARWLSAELNEARRDRCIPDELHAAILDVRNYLNRFAATDLVLPVHKLDELSRVVQAVNLLSQLGEKHAWHPALSGGARLTGAHERDVHWDARIADEDKGKLEGVSGGTAAKNLNSARMSATGGDQ